MITMPAEERRAYFQRLYPYLKISLVIFGSGFIIGLAAVSHFPDSPLISNRRSSAL
jgi:hypothetical protein